MKSNKTLSDYPELKELVDSFIEKDRAMHSGKVTVNDMLAIVAGCLVGVIIVDRGIDKKLSKLTERVEALEDKQED